MMHAETEDVVFDFNRFSEVRQRSLGRLTWRMQRYITGFLEPRLYERGFTDFKLSYLSLLANTEEQGITNSELARRACVSKQMMSKTVSLLEQQGYIYTEKNANDSRSSVIFLNERGKSLFINLHECITEMHQKFGEILGQDKLEGLVDTLTLLLDGLEQDTPPA